MGLYDSFIIPEMTCPRCKKTIKDVDFQTKDLFNMLNAYYLGDRVATNANQVHVLATCDACTETEKKPEFNVAYTFLEGFAYIENEQFVRLKVFRYKHDILKSQQPSFSVKEKG